MVENSAQKIAKLETQLKEANQKIAQLTEIIRLKRKQMYGKKTEIMQVLVAGQQSLFSDEELAQLQAAGISITEVIEKKERQVVRHRKPKVSGQRTAFLDGLPQVDQVIPLEDNNCPHCHQELAKVGEHEHSREVRLKTPE